MKATLAPKWSGQAIDEEDWAGLNLLQSTTRIGHLHPWVADL